MKKMIFLALVAVISYVRINQASAIFDCENGTIAAPNLIAVKLSTGTCFKPLSDFPSCLILEFLSYLSPNDIHKAARSCRLIRDDYYASIETSMKQHLPAYECNSKTVTFLLYHYFLERLEETFSDLGMVPTSVKDIINICLMDNFSRSDLMVPANNLKKAAKRAQLTLDEHDLAYYHNFFYFTPQYLFLNGLLSEKEYYKRACFMMSLNVVDKKWFAPRLLSFKDPIKLLATWFSADFAVILLKSSLCTPQERKKVLELAAESVFSWASEKCPDYDDILFKEIVTQPNLLHIALMNVGSFFYGDVYKCLLRGASEKVFQEAFPSSENRFEEVRYISVMTEFDAESFSTKFEFSFERVALFPKLNLEDSCHFDAFIHLISHEPADFSDPKQWFKNVLEMCQCSRVKDYWYLLFKHARNIPSLKSLIESYLEQLKCLRETDLSSKLIDHSRFINFIYTAGFMTLSDFLIITWPSSDSLFEPYVFKRFRGLEIWETIQVDLTNFADQSIVSRLPESLKGVLPWYPLHLSLLCSNTAVFAVIVKIYAKNKIHDQLETATVADFTIEALLNVLEEAESDLQLNASVPEFRKILKDRSFHRNDWLL